METTQQSENAIRPRCERYANASVILTMLAFGLLGIAWMFGNRVLGCLFIASPIAAMGGFLMGVLSWWAERKEKISPTGRRRAIFGRLFSGLYLCLAFFVFFLVHSIGQSRLERNNYVICTSHLKSLNFAAICYAKVNDGHLPPKADWQNAIKEFCDGENCFSCPADSSGNASYVYLGDSWMTLPPEKLFKNIPLFHECGNFHSNSEFLKDKLLTVFMDGLFCPLSPDELEDAIKRSRLEFPEP